MRAASSATTRATRRAAQQATTLAGALWPAVALGALAGLRSMTPLALVSRRLSAARARPEGLLAPLARRGVSRALTLAAVGECAADKTPLVPARTRPLPLAGRLLAGAAVAAAAAGWTGRGSRIASSPARAGLLGALGALAGTFAGYHLRRAGARALGRDWPAALAEDALCLLTTRALLARLPGH
jgi:uncharacterized membrane protein